ncbi:MAG: RagB/SusD family nutrient uptake outer membrane protein [Chitinophagaceae bacterium]|nr:RagB/SusD family nutrient uptake outer membrane protein [Chitinophagaceae bacterium]
MRNFKSTFFALLLALPFLMMLSGCEKFLDRKPLTATLEDLNQGGIEAEIFGIYSNLRNSPGFTTIPWLAVHDFRSEDSEKGSDAADGAEWVAPFDNFQYVKDLWATNVYWDDHMTLIQLANSAIHKADSLGLTDASTMLNIAEARFMRAFSYFDLVRTFGEVPIHSGKIYQSSDLCKPKSTVAEVYAFIDADLQFAAATLPASWGSQYPGRLSTGAAKALHAKTYLYRQNWAQALALCQQVIGSTTYSLNSSYYGIFKDAGENSGESIFEIQAYVSPNGSIDQGCGFATCMGVRAATATGWNLGWGWNTPTDALVNAFEAGDSRKGSTVLFSGQSDDPSTGGYGRVLPNSIFDPVPGPLPRKYWNKKIYADPAYRASTGFSDNPRWINKRIIRYADVLLMAAEASNELGQGATGISWLNQVRTRGGLSGRTYTTQAQMRTDLKHERRVEFGVEGERFFDLVRWGDALSALGSLGYTHRCRYYPIPQPVIDRCGGVIIQNPEW